MNKVDKGIAHVCAVFLIHWQVQEIVPPRLLLGIQRLEELVLSVLVRYVPDHDGAPGARLVVEDLLDVQPQVPVMGCSLGPSLWPSEFCI